VWGGLVPFGEVWRTGADENTTLSFSTPIMVGGKTLPAGSYGLHTIPGEKEWTVILSTQASAWRSYSYDAKEDAVRLTAVPREGPSEERLLFTLADPTERSVAVTLAWEKVRISFLLEFDSKAVVLASLKAQLRGLPRFGWQGWNGAAAWCVRNDTALDQAEEWVDRSIQMNRDFTNQTTKATLLEKKGDAKSAAELRKKALSTTQDEEKKRRIRGEIAKLKPYHERGPESRAPARNQGPSAPEPGATPRSARRQSTLGRLDASAPSSSPSSASSPDRLGGGRRRALSSAALPNFSRIPSATRASLRSFSCRSSTKRAA
jgi:hypothetical protein